MALALSLNIPEIIQYKLHGFAEPAISLLAKKNWYAHKSLEPIKLNLKKAKALLNKAGYYDGKNNKPVLTLGLKTTTYRPAVENARVIVSQAKKAGIIIKHRAFEWGTFYSDVKAKNTQLYILRWVGVTDPGHFYNIFHSLGYSNRTSYKNSQMDKILEQAQSTLDPNKRKVKFLEAQELAAQDLPYISLWHNKNIAVFRNNITSVTLEPNGGWRTLLKVKKLGIYE